MKIRIGTRGSRLALAQTDSVKQRLEEMYPEHEYEVVVIRTKGDMIQDKPLHQIGAKGAFVQEIEEQLKKGTIELAVHSMKDMPSQPEAGLGFAKLWKREDARDVLVLRGAHSLETLREGAVLATGSLRRAIELKRLRPDIQVVDIRGNVDTRLRKMEEQGLDGLVLAAAGLKRLGMEEKITCYLEPEQMIPAPAQGILALEYALDNQEIGRMLDALHDEETNLAGGAERAFLQEMGGDCRIPVGAYCSVKQGKLHLQVSYGKKNGDGQAKLYYAECVGNDSREVAVQAAGEIRRQMAGMVYLVSAGPGDTGLLTLRGKALIEKADCVIYDRLVAPELLEWTKTDCEKIYAGKEMHNHTMSQEEIQRLLVKKALEYEVVVRLKGGDAYVFGRGGEEGLWLLEHQVPFEVVPGVTSAVAGPAYAGIPVTHRGIAQGFHVVTAHGQQDEAADIDFEAIARGNETCVFLMGLSRLREIVRGLTEGGMEETMPVAVIAHATTESQQVVISDLVHIEERVLEEQVSSPALIVVGKVVELSEKLDFQRKKPLAGKQYVVPKIGKESSALAGQLREQGAKVVEVSVGEIRRKTFTITREKLCEMDWVVFTSVHGVDMFFAGLVEQGLDARALGTCKIAAVGIKTARRLERYGIHPDRMPKQYDAKSLAESMKEILVQEKHPVVCYVKASGVENELKEQLDSVCEFASLEVYENAVIPVEKNIREICEKCHGIIFTCSSSAERFLSAVQGMEKEQITAVSIGPKTSETLRKLGVWKILEAPEATYESIVKIMVQKGKNH